MRLGLTVLGLALTAGAAAQSPLPVEQWKTDKLKLTADSGVLAVEYRLKPEKLSQSGHVVFYLDEADLLFKTPIRLRPGDERIAWEFADLSPKNDCRIHLRPLVRDAEGEIFAFQPQPAPHLGSGGKTWSGWITPNFYAGEAGAATQDIYYVAANPKNRRPDGALEWIGFKLTARRHAENNRNAAQKLPVSGSLRLGEFSAVPAKTPYAHPFGYASSYLKTKGRYTFATRIFNEFQGVPVREFKKTIDFDPANPASGKQKLEFPLGPDGNYWIEYQITDAAGRIVAAGTDRANAVGNPDAAPATPVDTRRAPALGIMRINPDHPGRGVYRRPEPMKIELRVFPAGPVKLRWKLQPCEYDDVLDSGEHAISAPGSVFITPRTVAGRDAYRLTVEAVANGRVIDSQTYFAGYKTDFSKPRVRAGEMPDRRKIKLQPYNRTTYLPPEKSKIRTEAAAREHFREYLSQSRELARSLTVMIDLQKFEVLPGVFDFPVLDSFMDSAADAGCKITVRLAHADAHRKNLYRWPKYSRQIKFDGSAATGHSFYGAYAVADPGMTKLWFDAYRALFDRYRSHTAFEGYYIMQPGGEWTVVDQPWDGTLTGYDAVTVQGFRDWLKKQYTLPELNRRWGTALRSWNEINAPAPRFRDGVQPDLRLVWIDFCRYKAALGNEVWFPGAVNFIRSFDNDRITICYGAPSEAAKRLAGKLDYCHNGGNHEIRNLGRYVDAWKTGGIGWITEPHHPHRWAAYGDLGKKGWVLDLSVWVMTAQAGAGGSNLHIYYFPYPTLDRTAHYGGFYAYDAMRRFAPILDELHGIELLTPGAEVAVEQDPFTLYAKHRTTFAARLADLCRWFELLESDGIPYRNLADGGKPAKLILPNPLDEVISREAFDRYVAAVRNGAKLVMFANTGKYVPELGKEPFQLLKAFGIPAPSAAYRTTGTAVGAPAGKTPLFPGSIEFQTGDTFAKQLASDDVKKEFWRYRYRWIPQTDYFGVYPGHRPGGDVKLTFADGGAAASTHRFGKGEVLVFWGTPDISGDKAAGFMRRATDWAGAADPNQGQVLNRVLEAKNDRLKRHYLLIWNEQPGTYRVKAPNAPDGVWFLDDPVSSERLGEYTGRELRENGVELTWQATRSPLKFVRMMRPFSSEWSKAYRTIK